MRIRHSWRTLSSRNLREKINVPPLAPDLGPIAQVPETPPPPGRLGKRHFTERFAISPPVDRWTIAKGAFIGFLTGMGYSSGEIAKRVGDGTIAATVRGQWKNWQLPLDEIGGAKHRRLFIAFSFYERLKLKKLATKRGLTPEEFIRRIATCAIADDLYDAVTACRFDAAKQGARTALNV